MVLPAAVKYHSSTFLVREINEEVFLVSFKVRESESPEVRRQYTILCFLRHLLLPLKTQNHTEIILQPLWFLPQCYTECGTELHGGPVSIDSSSGLQYPYTHPHLIIHKLLLHHLKSLPFFYKRFRHDALRCA